MAATAGVPEAGCGAGPKVYRSVMGTHPLASRPGIGAQEPDVDHAETRGRLPQRAVALLLAVVVGVLADISRAHAGAPSEYIKERIEKVYDLVGTAGSVEAASSERQAAARKVLDEMFDWNEMGRRTLDKYWAVRSASERSEFIRLFSELFQRTYLSRIHLAEREKFQFLGDTIDGDRAAVKTKVVTRKGQEIPVDYLTVRSDGDRWKIYDLDVSGVSLIGNYRTQFTSLIGRSSYSEFIDKLRALIEKRPAASRDGFVVVGAGDIASCAKRVAMSITGHKTRSVFDPYHIVNPGDLQEAMRRFVGTHRAHSASEQLTPLT